MSSLSKIKHLFFTIGMLILYKGTIAAMNKTGNIDSRRPLRGKTLICYFNKATITRNKNPQAKSPLTRGTKFTLAMVSFRILSLLRVMTCNC